MSGAQKKPHVHEPLTTRCVIVIALVTGGAGFIGSHIVDMLVSKNFTVRVLDNFETGKLSNLATSMNTGRVRLLKGDITHKSEVEKAAKGVDVIFHEAALVDVPRSFKNPQIVHKVNTEGTINLLEGARRYDLNSFVFASSSSVYGDTRTLPVSEDIPLRPISPYAASKLGAEQYCQLYWRLYKLQTVSLRYFNVYGPRQTGGQYSGVISIFAKAIFKRKPLTINGDGNQTRDFVCVDDIIQANLNAIGTVGIGGEVFNIGTGKPTSVNELAWAMLHLSGNQHLKTEHAPPRKGDVPYSYANINEAAKRLNYQPKIGLEEGVSHVLKWFTEK